ncbi:hypothetical protein [Amnibacterium kyonggiense]
MTASTTAALVVRTSAFGARSAGTGRNRCVILEVGSASSAVMPKTIAWTRRTATPSGLPVFDGPRSRRIGPVVLRSSKR